MNARGKRETRVVGTPFSSLWYVSLLIKVAFWSSERERERTLYELVWIPFPHLIGSPLKHALSCLQQTACFISSYVGRRKRARLLCVVHYLTFWWSWLMNANPKWWAALSRIVFEMYMLNRHEMYVWLSIRMGYYLYFVFKISFFRNT